MVELATGWLSSPAWLSCDCVSAEITMVAPAAAAAACMHLVRGRGRVKVP